MKVTSLMNRTIPQGLTLFVFSNLTSFGSQRPSLRKEQMTILACSPRVPKRIMITTNPDIGQHLLCWMDYNRKTHDSIFKSMSNLNSLKIRVWFVHGQQGILVVGNRIQPLNTTDIQIAVFIFPTTYFCWIHLSDMKALYYTIR